MALLCCESGESKERFLSIKRVKYGFRIPTRLYKTIFYALQGVIHEEANLLGIQKHPSCSPPSHHETTYPAAGIEFPNHTPHSANQTPSSPASPPNLLSSHTFHFQLKNGQFSWRK
ncbi:hypothetical protein KFK09_012938 [Dendrobium nobile]|uniref:Uncharacterized protein n=1 Tax=Dendrobium nobile TaxID=94219 RepID=A0A8T3BGM2_DENNO|nr:hypothetical protein KFK09_012938 [Dendrobium nobile]